MKRKKNTSLIVLLSAVLIISVLSTGNYTSAASTIYVNDSQNVLGGNLSSAYAVGGTGTVAVTGDTYAITGNGIVKVGSTSDSTDTPEAALSGTVAVKSNTVKIGLYYKTASYDTAVSSSTLTNLGGGGFGFGYYDSSRNFCELASTTDKQITLTPDANNCIVVKSGVTNQVIYVHDCKNSSKFGVYPKSSAKALTKLSNNDYTYYGGFIFDRYNGNSKLTVINVLNVEDYVKGVIPYEMGNSWPIEALKAGAIAARNYVQANYGKYDTSYGFDIFNNTSDQVYEGTRFANSNTDAACDATANQYMTFNGQICSAYYYAANGGASENSENVFLNPLGYCKGKADPFEAAIDFYCKSWSKSFTTAEISSKLSSLGLSTISSITLTNTTAGNVYSVTMTDITGKKATLTRSSCTTFLNKLGFTYTSMHFAVTYNSVTDTYTVSGGGAGHNVGMSQWGANSMAKVYGKNYRQILGFYYTGVVISQGVTN